MKSPEINEAQWKEHRSFRNSSPDKSNQNAHIKCDTSHLDVFGLSIDHSIISENFFR